MYQKNLICIEPKLYQSTDLNTVEEKKVLLYPAKSINLDFLDQFENWWK